MRASFPTYKTTSLPWPDIIPDNWELVKIASVFKERKQTVSDKEFTPLSVTMQGIVPQLETAAKTDNGDNRKKVCKGDFVINSRSDRKGSAGISPLDGSVSVISTVLKPSAKLHERYVDYLLTNYYFQEEFYRYGKGIVADLWSTKYSNMKGMFIPLPPLTEQTAIANYLDAKSEQINRFIEKKQKLIVLLREQKQAIINELLVNGVYSEVAKKASGFEIFGDIPAHWNIIKLRFIGYCQNGMNKDGEYFRSGHPFMSYGDVYKFETIPAHLSGQAESTFDERITYSVVRGDVFFTRTSETIEEIGFASTCTETIKDATFSGFLIRFRPRPNILLPEYSKYFFRSSLVRRFFVKEMNIMTRASLSQNLVKNLPVLIPPISEQEEIATCIEKEITKIESTIDRIEKEIEKVKELKQSLIAEAVTGKIKVV